MSGDFDKLIQNLEKLEKTSFDSGLSIDKFLLPKKEAIKKYIASKNPNLSPFDIDLMVDGAEELYKKIEEREENKNKSDAEKNLSKSSQDTNENTNDGDLSGGTQGDDSSDLSSNSPNTNVTPPGPPPVKFVYQGRLDKGDPVVEVYFKGRPVKTQVFSGVTFTLDQALESMKFQGSRFGFLDADGISVEEDPDPPVQETTPQNGSTTSNNTTTPTNPSDEIEKKRQAQLEELKAKKEERKQQIKDFVDNLKKIYTDKMLEFEERVEQIKLEIKAAFFILKSKLQELTSKLINSLIAAAVAIPAMVIKITLPFFNFPDAIQGILVLVQLLLDLIAVVKDVVPFLKPIRYLPLVTSKENLAILGITLNPIIEGIFAILAPIQAFENIIFTLIDALLDFLSKTKESNFRKATKKLKKLGHLKKIDLPLPEDAINLITKIFWGTDNIGKRYENESDPPNEEGERLKLQDGTPVTVYSFSPDDVPEVVSMLDIFVVRNNRVVAYRQKIKFRDKDTEPEEIIRNLKSELESAALPIEVKDVSVSEFEQFVYDIKLPDGTVILGISEEAVEFYKTKYTLNFLVSE